MRTAWPTPPSASPPALERSDDSNRWEGRPLKALAVRLVVLVIPVMAAVVVATASSRLFPRPHGAAGSALWWCAVIAASTLALVVMDRQARRLLPLAALYKLTLIFPDRAPSRFRVALRAGTVRHLQQRLEESRRSGVGGNPSQAAANILVLASALSRHDRRTRGHSERVRGFTDLIAEEMHLTAHDRDRLRWAALLHDIGKVRVRPEILNKPGSLNAEEWDQIHRHPVDGAVMAAPLRPWLGPWMDAIEQHHERWDGRGYPNGLSGADISTSARIVAVADAFEVMTAPRSYRRSLGAAVARDELARCAGSHFDPTVVRAFLSISIGRLRWVIAPIAWVADIPVVRLAHAGSVAESATAGLAAKTLAAVTLAVVGGTVVASPPPASPSAGVPFESRPQPVAQQMDPATPPAPAPGAATGAASGAPAPAAVPPTTIALAGSSVTKGAPPPGGAPPSDRSGRGGSAPAGNPGPTTVDDALILPSGKSEKIAVLANDSDPDGLDPRSLTIVGAPAHGRAAVQGPPWVIRYWAPSGYVGSDSFQYRVCDTRGACSTGTVQVTIIP